MNNIQKSDPASSTDTYNGLTAAIETSKKTLHALEELFANGVEKLSKEDIQKLSSLDLIEQDNNQDWVIKKLGIGILERDNEPTLKDIKDTDDIDTVLERFSGTVFAQVFAYSQPEKKSDNLVFSGIDDCRMGGSVADFISKQDTKRAFAISNAVRPFFSRIQSIRKAIELPTTNKITILSPKGESNKKLSEQALIIRAINEYASLSGNTEIKKYFLEDISAIRKIDFGSYGSASSQALVFLTLRYIMTSESDSRLKEHPRKKEKKDSKHKTIQEIIDKDSELSALKKIDWNRDNIILTTGTGRIKNPCLFLNNLIDSMKGGGAGYDLCPDFREKLIKQPMIFFGESNKKEIVRNIIFQKHFFPSVLRECFGDDIQKTTKREAETFAEELVVVFEEDLPDIRNVLHLKESMGELFFSKVNILTYIIQNVSNISESQCLDVLQICRTAKIKKIPDELISKFVTKYKIPKSPFLEYEQLVKSYLPEVYSKDIYNSAVSIITSDIPFYGNGLISCGFKKEIDKTMEYLSQKHTLVIVDDTSYDMESLKGGGYSAIERIEAGLGRSIMTGKCPEILKHHTLARFDNCTKDGEESGIQGFMGFMSDIDESASTLTEIQEVLIDIVNHNPDSILLLSMSIDDIDLSMLSRFLEMTEELGLKLILATDASVPGIDTMITVSPVSETGLKERLLVEKGDLEKHLGVVIPDDIFTKTLEKISYLRTANQDPLNLAYNVFSGAMVSCLADGQDTIRNHDILQSMAFNLDTTDPESMRHLFENLQELPNILKSQIVGQDEVINEFCADLTTHLLGGGNIDSPLAWMIPGPTGVGKTLLAQITNKHFSLPLLTIDGTQYQEPHSVARLTGSPPGYVGDSDGEITTFLSKHEKGMIFIDELDKMHPSVRMSIMNLADEGKMTNGEGKVFQRRGIVVLAASNAGAEKLTPKMTKKEIIECIAVAFKDENGNPKPELANRFKIFPMLGIRESDFKRAIRQNLNLVQERPLMATLGVGIPTITDEVVEYIFDICSNPCRTHKEDNKEMGFGTVYSEKLELTDTFFNLREITRAINASVSPLINNLMQKKYKEGSLENKKFKMDVSDGKVILVLE